MIRVLKNKLKYSEETVEDKFMYQDRKETERELKVAQQILKDMPKPANQKNFKSRVWNKIKYEEHRK